MNESYEKYGQAESILTFNVRKKIRASMKEFKYFDPTYQKEQEFLESNFKSGKFLKNFTVILKQCIGL